MTDLEHPGPTAHMSMLRVDLGDGIFAGFTSRHGGQSIADYAQANLSVDVGDDLDAVARNRGRLASTVGVPVIFIHQVHGVTVRVLTSSSDADDVAGQPVDADGLLTSLPGYGLAIQAADCAPVLLADPVSRIIAAVHAGRRGMLAGIAPAAVASMERAGSRREHIRAAIGPTICGACYEVPDDVAADAERRVPGSRCVTHAGTSGIDIPGAIARQLADVGLRHVTNVGVCTFEDADYFSYRRDGGRTGRQVGLIARVS